MASATALMICGEVGYLAIRKGRSGWTFYIAWVLRVGTAVTGCWLFIVAPSRTVGFAAIAIYAVVYGLCERAAWRRVRSEEASAL